MRCNRAAGGSETEDEQFGARAAAPVQVQLSMTRPLDSLQLSSVQLAARRRLRRSVLVSIRRRGRHFEFPAAWSSRPAGLLVAVALSSRAAWLSAAN